MKARITSLMVLLAFAGAARGRPPAVLLNNGNTRGSETDLCLSYTPGSEVHTWAVTAGTADKKTVSDTVRKTTVQGNALTAAGKPGWTFSLFKPLLALQGSMPGVTVLQGNGLPGSEVSIQLRGAENLKQSNAPRIVVDGIILGRSSMDLASGDMVSVTVLKGASETAM